LFLSNTDSRNFLECLSLHLVTNPPPCGHCARGVWGPHCDCGEKEPPGLWLSRKGILLEDYSHDLHSGWIYGLVRLPCHQPNSKQEPRSGNPFHCSWFTGHSDVIYVFCLGNGELLHQRAGRLVDVRNNFRLLYRPPRPAQSKTESSQRSSNVEMAM